MTKIQNDKPVWAIALIFLPDKKPFPLAQETDRCELQA